MQFFLAILPVVSRLNLVGRSFHIKVQGLSSSHYLYHQIHFYNSPMIYQRSCNHFRFLLCYHVCGIGPRLLEIYKIQPNNYKFLFNWNRKTKFLIVLLFIITIILYNIPLNKYWILPNRLFPDVCLFDRFFLFSFDSCFFFWNIWGFCISTSLTKVSMYRL